MAGVRSGRAEAILREVYAAPLAAGVPFVVTDFATAELVKVAANAFLATKISFINAMAEVCEAAGADVTRLAEALSTTTGSAARPAAGPRLRRRLPAQGHPRLPDPRPGAGRRGGRLVPGEVDTINTRRRARMVELARELAGGSLAGRSGRRARARRSSPTPTTSATRPPWTSPALHRGARG